VVRRAAPALSLPEELRASWRRLYAENDFRSLPWFRPDPSPELRRAVTEGWLPRGGAALDVGCGAGSNALFLARAGFRTSAVDLAPAAIEAAQARARRRGLTVDFRIADALRLPFGGRSFRTATDFGCFHTLPLPLRGAYAYQLARVIRPEGRFLLSWITREHTGAMGPTHRPSLAEVAETFEPHFLFRRVEYAAGSRGFPHATALLERRTRPQPPPR
jgi:SAM-dependent methyltransferase